MPRFAYVTREVWCAIQNSFIIVFVTFYNPMIEVVVAQHAEWNTAV